MNETSRSNVLDKWGTTKWTMSSKLFIYDIVKFGQLILANMWFRIWTVTFLSDKNVWLRLELIITNKISDRINLSDILFSGLIYLIVK